MAEVARFVAQVVAGELGGGGDAQARAHAHVGDQVVLVDAADARRQIAGGGGDGHRVALDRIDRQLDAQLPGQDRAVAAQGQHIGLGLKRALVGHHLLDPVAGEREAPDRGAVVEAPAQPLAGRRQALGEQARIAALVGRAEDRAGELVPGRRQRRVDSDGARDVDDLHLLAVLGQDLGLDRGLREARRVAVEIQQAAVLGVVGDRGLGHDPVQLFLGVEAQAVLAQGVDARPLGGALAQELERPGPEARVGTQAEAQRLVGPEQRLEQDPGRRRRGPGVGMAGRDQAGVAGAGLFAGALAPLDDRDLVAVLEQLVGRGDADDPGAHDQDLHGPSAPWY